MRILALLIVVVLLATILYVGYLGLKALAARSDRKMDLHGKWKMRERTSRGFYGDYAERILIRAEKRGSSPVILAHVKLDDPNFSQAIEDARAMATEKLAAMNNRRTEK